MLKLITENQLDEWVRRNSRIAQEVIVELVWRLVAASCPNPIDRRFPLGDSIGQHGPDGVLNTFIGFEPYVPSGLSYWEIGTGLDAGKKATDDYRDLTRAIPENIRRQATFVFVTPLSARRGWEYTWKKDAQAKWIEEQRAKREWKDIRVIDGTKLIEWLHHFPAVELWLAGLILGVNTSELRIETPEQRWDYIRKAGSPQLVPQIFLLNRGRAMEKLKELFSGTLRGLYFETHFPGEVVDFVAAYLASLDEEERLELAGRCLIIKGEKEWEAIVTHYRDMILVADPRLDLHSEEKAELLQKALQAGHRVIMAVPRGRVTVRSKRDTLVSLQSPSVHQLQETLEKIGYSRERARSLAQKSEGRSGALLRLLQGLPITPSWSQESAAADLALAMLIGAWDEENEADRKIVEELTGEPYEQWIRKLREVLLRHEAPLICQNGKWKFILRYEAWYTLGSRIFNEHLDRLQKVAVKVLKEKDPQFDLPKEERYAASIYGKVFSYSSHLRLGLAETLALLGAQPEALIHCSPGKAETTAVLIVRELLAEADWLLWASFNDVLPLLAEAAPGEFFGAVERALSSNTCPFYEVFAQEGDVVFGRNYMTGLLWALETLAWDPDYLVRTVVCLGKLAERDPGGQWGNRPINSLRTILLPWFPQTCAPVEKRVVAVKTLLKEAPEIGWTLLLNLLPQTHSVSFGSRKPTWRETIPEDWDGKVTVSEYWEQVERYTELALEDAKGNCGKLGDLIDRFEDLPLSIQEELLTHPSSDKIQAFSEEDRTKLWEKLTHLANKHRKFADARWAMPADRAKKIESVVDRIAPKNPALRYRRLFTERDSDLFDEAGNYEHQRKVLTERRQKAVMEIEAAGGIQAVLDFALSVGSPWKLGFAYGTVAGEGTDREILPGLLNDQNLLQFVDGYIRGRFHSRQWKWIDNIDTAGWTCEQIAQFLCSLPFVPETWDRVERLLGGEESLYWKRVSVNPYETDKGLEIAVDKLIKYNRPLAAIDCIAKILYDKQSFDGSKAVKALLDALQSREEPRSIDPYEICEIIKSLQNAPDVRPEDLFRVEWAYLPLLDGCYDVTPRTLEQKLAEDPEFFCEVIRIVFKSEKEERSAEVAEEQKRIAENAFRLLSNWRTPPGSQEDGTFDAKAFQTWLERVKRECKESGHLEVAMEVVGQVLIYAPSDPNGLWIHRAVADVLNAEDADRMRSGFSVALYNSRGVHWVDFTGKPERELAEKYRKRAEEVESCGYHRLANTLRDVAITFEKEAEQIIDREKED